MREILIGLILGLLLTACSQSPTGPTPPVLRPDTFEELIEMLDKPAKVAMWIKQFTTYSNPYLWELIPGHDQAYALAYHLWEQYINGYSRGKCASFASLMLVCARHHGYECGTMTYYYWNPDGTNVRGHMETWVKEANGYSVLSNDHYVKEKYKTLEELKEAYIKLHVHKNGYLTFYDAYWKNGEVHQEDDYKN